MQTPGALVVPDSFLTYDTKSINLSSKDIIDITNKQRTLNGNLPILKENSKLDFSAEKKLQDMFVKGYFEHTSPDGVGVGDLADQIDYEYIVIGENLALGNFKNDQALVDAWMASPGHRANILNKRYIDIGVSVGKGIYNGKSVWMAVQHFGLPKSACPSIDQVLKGVIDLDQKDIKAMEIDMASRRAIIDSEIAKKEGVMTNSQIDNYNTLVKEYNKFTKHSHYTFSIAQKDKIIYKFKKIFRFGKINNYLQNNCYSWMFGGAGHMLAFIKIMSPYIRIHKRKIQINNFLKDKYIKEVNHYV